MCRFCASEKRKNKNRISPAACALLAATFYALSTPFSKLLLKHAEPAFLAAFLYLGAGMGVGIMYLLRRERKTRFRKPTKVELPYVIGMIVLDTAAPICLMLGMGKVEASNAALLGNFEIAATALIAQLFFREKISARLWLAILLITAAGVVLSVGGSDGICFRQGDLLVILAACLWGLENNCTRKISSGNTYEIVILKGFFSGGGSLAVAFLSGESFPSPEYIVLILLLGFAAYGVSIFLYVRAQRELGAARTGAYYAAAPFLGTFLAFLVNGDKPTSAFFAGLILMLLGAVLTVRDTLKARS